MSDNQPGKAAASEKKAAVSNSDLKPFLAAVLLVSEGKKDIQLAKNLLSELRTFIDSTESISNRTIVKQLDVRQFGSVFVGTILYCEEKVPAWLTNEAYHDKSFHHVTVAAKGKWAALVSSDTSTRPAMLRNIKGAKPISRQATQPFVGPEARTLWLNGIHASTHAKADSKTLMGTALEYALDPLGDQTYAMSAIRSIPEIKGINDSAKPRKVIGVSPSASRVWIGRSASWDNFVGELNAIFEHMNIPVSADNRYGFLSQPLLCKEGIGKAYELAILPRELLDSEAPETSDLEDAHNWAYEARFDVTGDQQGMNFEVAVRFANQALGSVPAEVELDASGKVSLSLGDWNPKDRKLRKQRATCARYLRDPRQIKVYYNTGHALADGYCFAAGFTDQVAAWTPLDLQTYSVDKEKPALNGGPLAAAIGGAGDNSLFGYVQKVLCREGWLACDDGAMEVGDFIHWNRGELTLVHVKGAGSSASDRTVSVSDFEIVVSQGIKNIRHFDKQKLITALKAGQKKSIAAATWKDGKPTTRGKFIEEIQSLPANVPRNLMILQPRLTVAELEACANRTASADRVQRFKQLNALVLSAQLSAMAVGAKLVVFAAE